MSELTGFMAKNLHIVSAVFRFWAPWIYRFYLETLAKLKAEEPQIASFHTRTAFAAMSFNFGPNAVTAEHTDSQNYAGGFCVVTSLGSFDSTRGGHLFVRELGIVAEFPVGASILLPSAILNHGNTPIGQDEYRASVTMYTAGGLFRRVDQGYVRQGEMAKAELDQFFAQAPLNWEAALGRYSTVDSLTDDHKRAFDGLGELEL